EGATLQSRLSRISSNPQEVVRQADIVLLCLPGFSIREELQQTQNWLTIIRLGVFILWMIKVLMPA
ncbi:MAG: hypothetical protein IKQ23_10460, partial [Treponema sp.]|nr:hypothetical protein [Treponema sp.]